MDYTCQNEVTDMQLLQERQQEIERQWNELLKEKREYDARIHALEQKEKQFEMKWDMLIKETQQLAEDKNAFERKKLFYERVNSFEIRTEFYSDGIVTGDRFFSGVNNEIALKKRYKDLIKIYHPDSDCGDTETIQEINREYEYLRQQMMV